ncbi:cytochrome d ubiquinol oxidase subunit II [Bdellovibrio sp. HCB274]|uniref:cytochrome d ubiquinol oxidase subunit II n=1 Tax=Bdellovibrio sp. HCB274 TaxID=3394361 RepID=UPI0039B4D39E
MVEILIFFIAASLLLYVVLGGADYGAGIVELTTPKRLQEKQRHVINEAMGPVWEANHMWLIIVVVILFMGFPTVFSLVMVHLHIPIVALLVGIVARGTAFTFRHYDAVYDSKSQNTYSWIFSLSSVWTTFWLGVVAGSLWQGDIDPTATGFFEAYVNPWMGWVPIAMGFFMISIFSFLASIYLIGESENSDLKAHYRRWGFIFNTAVVITGGAVFVAAYLEQSPFLILFLKNPFSIACVVMATLFFFVLWNLLRFKRSLWIRLAAAAQAALILFGWYFAIAPAAVLTPQGAISFVAAAAPEPTLRQLSYALGVGSLLIFPSLFYLLKVFKLSGKSLQNDSAKNDGIK